MVSRFCRDVETELMTEEGPMVTTLMWWEGGGAGAGTITVGWWVGAGVGRSCETGALSLSAEFLGAATSLPSVTEGAGQPSKPSPSAHHLESLHQSPQQPVNLLHAHFWATQIMNPPTPLILRNEGKVAWRGTSDHLRLHGPSLSGATPAFHI